MAEEGLDLDFNPFEEEFSDSDVVGRKDQDIIDKQEKDSPVIKKEEVSGDEGKAFEFAGFSQTDIDQLVSYDEQRRKKIAFENKLDENINLNIGKRDDENNFRDFIVAPKISGSNKTIKGDARIYPASLVHKTGERTEISDHPFKERGAKEKSAVIINRDETGDVDNIEIVCSCGERVLLKFNVTKDQDLELTKTEYRKIDKAIPFSSEDLKDNEGDDYTDAYDQLIEEGKEATSGKKLSEEEAFEKKKEQVYKEISEKSKKVKDKKSDEPDEGWEEINDEEIDLGDIDLSDI